MTQGLLLLSGGQGTRMGSPKHALEHPAGGTWGGHLVGAFRAVFPQGGVQVLGEALPDEPSLPRLDDPRLGPAKALQAWAQAEALEPPPERWWIVACDQVRWTPVSLRSWAVLCQQADPANERWVIAEHDGHLQPLGGWFPNLLRPQLAAVDAKSLLGLVAALPHLVLPQLGEEWCDVDTPEEARRFRASIRLRSARRSAR
jgi:molybdopterin-guanine dinucleotide biosynthesis protein A